jgi:membrane protein required for colicin V production
MVPIDWIALSLISVFSVIGLFNGFAKELFSLAAWLVSLIIAWSFGPLLFPYLERYIVNEEVRKIASFLCLFLGLFIILKLMGSVLSKTLNILGLGGLDKMAGAVFGGLKITLVLSSLFLLNLDYLETRDWWKQSYAMQITHKVEGYFGDYLEPIMQQWELKSEAILNKENINRLL